MNGLAVHGPGRALYAEWTKLRTAPVTALLPSAAAVMTIVLGAAVCAAASPDTASCADGCDIAKLAFSGVYLGQLAVIVFAVLTITGEYQSGLIGTTLGATPQRVTVFAAKAVAVAFAVLPAALVGVSGSLITGRILLPRNGFTAARGYPSLSLDHEPTLRAAAGTVVYLVLVALFSFGIATVLRRTVTALTMLLGLLYLTPILAQFVADESWHARIEKYAPMTAGLTVQATRDRGSLPLSPEAGLGVMAAYAGAALVLSAALFAIRDA